MKLNIQVKSKKYAKYEKILNEIANSDENRFVSEVCGEVAFKLINWEMLVGKEMVKELLKTYMES
jgi:hypothetical protein